MSDFYSRRFPKVASWAVLVLAIVGWTLPAGAQQFSPGPLAEPDLAPKQGTGFSTDTSLGNPGWMAGGIPGANAFQPPKVLNHPTPSYPELAHLNRVEGVVTVRFSIDDTGHVTNVFVTKTSGSVLLDSLVREPTLRDWTFQPAMLNGKPLAGSVTKEFEFRLDPNEQRQLAEKRLALPIGTPEPPYPPEALVVHPPLKGSCTITVRWTKAGLVDLIYLPKPSGFPFLDHVALRFAYANWRTDTATAAKDQEFTKVINFTPP